jgi:hypothetical protein
MRGIMKEKSEQLMQEKVVIASTIEIVPAYQKNDGKSHSHQ